MLAARHSSYLGTRIAAAALVSSMVPAIAAGTGPQWLTSAQMDTISAGGMAVTADSVAVSPGDSGLPDATKDPILGLH